MKLAGFELAAPLALAPMAGVTDRPFRRLCRAMGAGIAASEMVTADIRLWRTAKTRFRLDLDGEPEPRAVQIAGADPRTLAEAARLNADRGAQLIDINMGCPAKKVCNRAAGSALLRDEALVRSILEAVVHASPVPVTLKMRTGWDPDHRNAVAIARMAEDTGIAALAIHGRTRADLFRGDAEYDTIRDVVAAVKIPVFANGDIDSPEKAARVLAATGAAGIMIGRAAHGRPWIFRQVRSSLTSGAALGPPSAEEVRDIIVSHLESLHAFYGEAVGVRIARKHIGWYCRQLPGIGPVPAELMTAHSAYDQLRRLEQLLDGAAAAVSRAA